MIRTAFYLHFYFVQVERRVVNLLAAADELSMLKEGSSVHVEVQDRNETQFANILEKLNFAGANRSGVEDGSESFVRGKQLRLRIRDPSTDSDSSERYFNA